MLDAVSPAAEVDLHRRHWDLKTAERIAQTALAESPHSLDLLVAAARVRLAQSRENEAIELLDRAIQQDPDADHPVALSITAHRLDWQLSEAMELGERSCQTFAASSEIRIALGRTYRAAGNDARALELFSEAHDLAPGDHRAIGSRALALAETFQWTDALELVDELIGAYGHESSALLAAANVLADAQEIERALRLAEQATELNPWGSGCYGLTAQLLAELGRIPDAERLLDRAVRSIPECPDIYVARAKILSRCHRRSEAAKSIQSSLEIDRRHEYSMRVQVELLRADRKYDEAISSARSALAVYPRSPDLASELAWALAESGRSEEAIACARRGLEVEVALGNADARTDLIGILCEARQFEEAEQEAQAYVAASPLHQPAYIALSQVLTIRDRDSEAAEVAARAVQLNERDPRAWELRIACLRYAERWTEAQEEARSAQERFPNHTGVRMEAARVLAAVDKLEPALALSRQVVDLDPYSAEASNLVCWCLGMLKRYGEAEAVARTAVDGNQSDASLHLALANALSNQDRDAEAAEEAAKAVRISPQDVGAWENHSLYLRYAGLLDEAVEVTQKALGRFPKSPQLMISLSNILKQLRRPEEALEVVSQVLEDAPDHVDAIDLFCRLLCADGRFEDAERIAREALSKNPKESILVLLLGYVMSSQGRFSEAALIATEAIDRGCDDPDIWVSRVDWLDDASRFDEANAAAVEAIALHSTSAAIRIQAALLWARMHRHEDAIASIKHALEIDAANEWAVRNHIWVLCRARRYSEAERALRTTLASMSDRVSPSVRSAIYGNAAFLYESIGRIPDALDAVELALEASPRDSAYLASKLRLLCELRRFEEAKHAAESIMAELPFEPDVHVRAAWVYAEVGDYQRATRIVLDVVTSRPRHLWAMQSHIDFLRYAGRYDEAYEAAGRYRSIHPLDPELLQCLGELEEDRGNYQSALALYEEATALDPYDPRGWSKSFSLLLLVNMHSQAEAVASEGLTRCPDDPDLLMCIGRLHDHRRDFDAAIELFERGIEGAPEHAGLWLAWSMAMRSVRRYGQAERVMEELAVRCPHEPMYSLELAWLHLEQHRVSNARSVVATLSNSACDDYERSRIESILGWIEFSVQEYASAEQHFRAAQRERPHDPEPALSLTWALARQGGDDRLKQAERLAYPIAERGIAVAHACLGVVAYQQHQIASSEYHLKRSLSIDPWHSTHVDLGALYTKLGRYDEAESEFTRAIERDQYDAGAHTELGALYLVRDNDSIADAIREFRQALAIDPGAVRAAIGLSQAFVRDGEDGAAEGVLRRALEKKFKLRTDQWQVHLALARLLIYRGDKQQEVDLHADAYGHAQQAIAHAPDTESEPHFIAGVAYHRMGSIATDARGGFGYRSRAAHHLRECIRRDGSHSEAHRNLQLLEREIRAARPAVWGGYAVASLSIVLLTVVWVGFFRSEKVTAVVLATTTPVLVGLFTVSLLLPVLIRLKLPGFEADLQAGSDGLLQGPVGQVTIGDEPSRFALSVGPIGQMPRHG